MTVISLLTARKKVQSCSSMALAAPLSISRLVSGLMRANLFWTPMFSDWLAVGVAAFAE